MPTPSPKKEVIKLHVQFTIMTPDQLKEIKFGLDKSKAPDGVTDSWKITFSLKMRDKKEDPLALIIDTEVDADLKDAPLAEETAAKGLNRAQSDHLTLNVATSAERVKAGKLKDPTLKRAMKATLPARNA